MSRPEPPPADRSWIGLLVIHHLLLRPALYVLDRVAESRPFEAELDRREWLALEAEYRRRLWLRDRSPVWFDRR